MSKPMHGDSSERAEKLSSVFGPVGSGVALMERDPWGSRWPISPKRLTPGLLAHERWLSNHPRGHGWESPHCDESHCGDRPEHLRTRASRRRMARASGRLL